ncbi:MAG: peptidyl-prolyl cis-trans isomerase [Candidatus Latescibacterota bacterium]|nr:peptidyl-prolyl cis-trans isomerase [Candidatus Latescibacterota bacterium]
MSDSEPHSAVAEVAGRLITEEQLAAFVGTLPTRARQQALAETAALQRQLQTLVDRELLIAEARVQKLQADTLVRVRVAEKVQKELARRAMRIQVLERAVPTQEDTREAFAAGWNEWIDVQEIYVSSAGTAEQVLRRARGGEDFISLGREFNLDRVLKVPVGGPQRTRYAPMDKPEEIVQALLPLEAGQITEVIPHFDGFVVATIEGRQAAVFEDIEQRIARALNSERRRVLRGAYLKDLNSRLSLVFHEEALDEVASILQAQAEDRDRRSGPVSPAPAMSYADTSLDVGQVLRLVESSATKWAVRDRDAVMAELKNRYVPNLLMAMDAKQKGLEETSDFVRWRALELEDEIITQLRHRILADLPDPTMEELRSYYEEHKRQFRIPGQATVRDLLVETPEEARRLAARIDSGAFLADLIPQHTIRSEPEDGVFFVYDNQRQVYGELWFATVMNAPLGKVHGPLQTQGGYSVFEVLDRRPESHHRLEQSRVRRAVEREVRGAFQRQAFNAYLDDLRDRYRDRVQVFDDRLQAMTITN